MVDPKVWILCFDYMTLADWERTNIIFAVTETSHKWALEICLPKRSKGNTNTLENEKADKARYLSHYRVII